MNKKLNKDFLSNRTAFQESSENESFFIESSSEATDTAIHVAETILVVPADVTEMNVVAQGKRGIVFKGTYKGQEVAVKTPRPNSHATNTIGLEATYLKKVNKLGIGPKLLFADDDYVVMKFIKGERINDFLLAITTSPALILEVLNKVLSQLFKLDEKGINKYELTNPYKHILITAEHEPVLIDFERARHAAKPKNINQFAQYLQSRNIRQLLEGILDYKKLLLDVKEYQKTKELFFLKPAFTLPEEKEK